MMTVAKSSASRLDIPSDSVYVCTVSCHIPFLDLPHDTRESGRTLWWGTSTCSGYFSIRDMPLWPAKQVLEGCGVGFKFDSLWCYECKR